MPATLQRAGGRSEPITYVMAVAATIVAVLLRYVLDPWMGDTLPLVTLFGAVAAAVWIGGHTPAILAGTLGYIACNHLFIPPRGEFAFGGLGNVIGLLAYVFTCSLIIVFGESTRRAHMRASEQRELLQVTLRSIGDAVITTDVDGTVTYMNTVAESLTGWVQPDALDQPLDRVFRIVNEDTRQPVDNPATTALHSGVAIGLAEHTRLIRKDGTECPIDDSAAPIKDERGVVSGCVLIFRDVSAQRRGEQERARQLVAARFLASIIESSDDAIISKALDGTIQSWNAAAERLFGHSAEQAVGRHISLVIPPERIGEEEHIIANLKAGRRIEHFETERMRADGSCFVVSLTISPIKDEAGRVVGASKIVRDVTRQRQAELRERQLLAEAAAANAKFRAFFDQGALFAGIMHANGTVVEANRRSWESCGYRKEQVIGRPFWDGPWWTSSAELVEQIKAGWALAAGGQVFRAELPYFTADGSERAAHLTIQPILDDTGRVLFLAPTWEDITERKRLEDNLRSLAADLSDADRRKNEFLALLAHELRNPLASISNAARTIRLGGSDGDALRSASSMLDRQVGQMVRLIDDLLDLSRITRGQIALRRERTELRPIVNQAVEAVRALYPTMHHELSVTLPARPVYVDGDPARLTQVVGNLLNNACKFTDSGGRIAVTVEEEAANAVIRVRDNGIGIAAENLGRIFDMFAQLETSLERSRDGLGIGLTLVKMLVELHGGTIAVHSSGLGRGSEFVVRLPVLTMVAAAAAIPPSAAGRMPATIARRILIVDDSHDGAESLSMLLQLAGHETCKAHDGVEALDAAERIRPDVILLDIGLPRMNGYETCRRIRSAPWSRGMVVVALTGWGGDEDRQQSREAGFDSHMVKPVDHDVLLTYLASLPPAANAGIDA